VSYVGDVLSYYIDAQFKESLLAYAEEKRVVYEAVQSLGYKPKITAPATTKINVFQTVPAIGDQSNVRPDMRYALTLNGLEMKSQNGVTFRAGGDINFKFSSSYDPMAISVIETDNATNLPSKYLLKKTQNIYSGTVSTDYFTFNAAEKYSRVSLSNINVTEIINMTDSDGNEWKGVPFLAQDTLFEEMENDSANDPELSQYSDDAPYLLKLIKTPRRYTTFIRADNKTEIRFGAGVSDNPDEEIIPNPGNVGSSLPGSPSFLDTAFDPSNFLSTRTYGLSPSNTTLTVKYAHGGGVDDNVVANDINNISAVTYTIDDENLDSALVQESKNSVSAINPEPATGGKSGESIEEIRQNALAYFQAQQRAVTKEDYIVRAYSLPAKYGNISKAYIVQDDQLNQNGTTEDAVIQDSDVGNSIMSLMGRIPARIPNPLALNMYVLGYDSSKRFANLNAAVKQNLKTYLGQYRMVTDAVNIKDA